MGSPLWKRGVRGDFVNIFDSIGVIVKQANMEVRLYLLPAAIKSIRLENQEKKDNCKHQRFIL